MNLWFVSRGADISGPFTESAMFDMIERLQVRRGDSIAAHGGSDWWPVENVPIFARRFAPAPWHHHPAVIAPGLVCCWPVGLVLLWLHPRAPLWLKLLLSTIFAAGLLVYFATIASAFGGLTR